MADYRVISTDLRTGTRIAEIPLSGLKYGHRLNDAESVVGNLRLDQTSRGQALALNDAVDECRRLLVVERDGVIVAHGVVWAAPYAGASMTRAVSCAGLWSVLRRRYITSRLSWTGVDQFTITRAIVAHAQAKSGGDLGITTGANLSGVTRDRTYESFDLKECAEAVEQLAAVDNGFDFAIDCSWDPATGALLKVLNLANRRGRTYVETGHVFEVGRNVTKFDWPSDGSEVANSVRALGAGEGARAVVATAVDTSMIQPLSSGGPGYPLLEAVMSEKDVSDRGTLNGHARAKLAAVSSPVTVPKLTVRADVDPILGSYITGDAARIIVPPDTDPRFPDGLDTYRRIIGWDVTVGEQGEESVDLFLGLEP